MQKRIILSFFTFVLVGLALGCSVVDEGTDTIDTGADFAFPERPANLESATVTNVVDGDTVDLSTGVRVRLIGVNTPESDRPYYQEAKDFVKNQINGKQVFVEYDVEKIDQYGRTLAYLWLGERMVNADLVLQGYANAYTFAPNVRYADLFVTAEQNARENGRGLWKQGVTGLEVVAVNADAPGNDAQNLNGEWIEIRNNGDNTINLQGFSIKDQGRNTYIFKSLNLAPGQQVKVYSGCGNDTRGEVYWCSNSAIWNNDGDSAFITDANGLFVTTYTY